MPKSYNNMCNVFSLWAEPINKALFLLHERKVMSSKQASHPAKPKKVDLNSQWGRGALWYSPSQVHKTLNWGPWKEARD
jgi:hypothetical protein